MNINCYEVVKHRRGESEYMDQVVTADECCTKEQAEEIAFRLNNTSNELVRGKYVYYVRMRINA